MGFVITDYQNDVMFVSVVYTSFVMTNRKGVKRTKLSKIIHNFLRSCAFWFRFSQLHYYKNVIIYIS